MINSFWWFLAGLLPQVFEKIKDVGMEYFLINNYWVQVAVIEYLYIEGSPTKLGSRTYDGRVIDEGVSDCVAEVWESLGPCPRMFTFPNNTFVIASFCREVQDGNSLLRISYPRFFINPDKFIKDALLRYQESRRGSSYTDTERYHSFNTICEEGIQAYASKGGDIILGSPRKILWQPEKHREVGKLSIDELPLSQSQEEAVKEIDKWANSSAWYKERKIPWRRGYLLYGDPGTGKTTFVKALSNRLKSSVYSWDLAAFSNDTFRLLWSRQTANISGVKIYLLEDLDTVFNGRENISCRGRGRGDSKGNSSGLGWECLLSVLDGVETAEGVLLFATTNRPELLDSSFANVVDGKVQVRPGRVDKAVHFGPITRDSIYEVANRILRDEQEAQEIADFMQSATVAEVQEICVKRALTKFWGPPTS